MDDICYLCGTSENITRDHLPPASFFPPASRKNLITVPCCKVCNESYSLDDEAVRLWAASSLFNSEQGKWIWENKVVKSTLKRSPKLKGSLHKFVGTKKLKTQNGELEMPTFGIPTDRLNKFIKRLCKGLLYHFHPDYSYSDAEYIINNILPSQEVNEVMPELLGNLIYDSRGDTVFRFWRGFAIDKPDTGIFVFTFYNGVCITVTFGHNLEIDESGIKA